MTPENVPLCITCQHAASAHYNDDGEAPPAPQNCHVWIGDGPIDPNGDYCPCSGGGVPR